MPIQVLPQEVAMLIAAGEVINRPADAVKELVENSLDAILAGRSLDDEPVFPMGRIQVEVRGGGAQLVRVTDDGCGIPGAELATAFQRHATSKIAAARDLGSVTTLGFRGEALASIAAVAQVNAVSKTKDEPAGTYLGLAGGEVVNDGHRAWAGGTSIAVRNLFFNVPARRRFLRSLASEAGHIAQLMCQFALAYPEVQFTLETEGRVTFRTPGSGQLAEAIAAVYGNETLHQMTPVLPDDTAVGEEGPVVLVDGYVGQPSLTHANRTHISLFVNRRWVQNRALVFAVAEAYHDLLPPGRQPVAVLNLTAHPQDVDVNVHPAKTEIRFVRERQAFADVQRAVRGALVANVRVRELTESPSPAVPSAEPPRQAELTFAVPPARPETTTQPPTSPEPSETTVGGRRLPLLRVIGQVGGAFIVAEGPSGLYLIDQHRAHERVLYDRFLGKEPGERSEEQLLLEPLALSLTPRQAASVEERLGDLAGLGLRLEPFGERTFLLRAVPASLSTANLQQSVLEIIDQALDGKDGASWQERALVTMACQGAVKAGQSLSLEEMRQLIVQLEASNLPQTCPHGAPTMVHLSQAQLEKGFLRR
ncbi:MAG: DNA mismatch repair endonuclease MutL [Chloroflexota bacterium]